MLATACTREGDTQRDIDQKRHTVLLYTLGLDSAKKLSKGECSAILALWKSEDSWKPNDDAAAECAAIVAAWLKDNGQQELPLANEAPPAGDEEKLPF